MNSEVKAKGWAGHNDTPINLSSTIRLSLTDCLSLRITASSLRASDSFTLSEICIVAFLLEVLSWGAHI